MSVAIAQVNGQATRVFMGTFTNGEVIHEGFANLARTHNIQAATFSMLGGLTEVVLSGYDFVGKVRQEALVFTRPVEIVAGHGTISALDGAPHIHIHLALSFRDSSAPFGIAVIGGHVAKAIAFAVEFTLTAYDGRPVNRQLHPETGLWLWDLPDLTPVVLVN